VSSLLQEALPAERLVVAVDPGKVSNRVWLASGERGLVREPVSLRRFAKASTSLSGSWWGAV
jgi:hypothetical protein